MYKFFLKRVIEILLILIFLPIFIFIYVSVYLMVKINFGSPILFKQLRPGKNAKLFNIYKFRTMKMDYDSNGILKPDKSRLTSFGKFLRSISFDELPSLWSVIR